MLDRGYNVNAFFVDMIIITEKNSTQLEIKQFIQITTSFVQAKIVKQQIIINKV